MPDYDKLQERLGWRFRNVELLRQAFTHPSVAHENATAIPHNQRLEFLGDAVLQLALTRALFERYPTYEEGPLTKARARLVNRHSLAEQARLLNLGDLLILSRGEETHGGRERTSALADTFEALLGALYLDAGFEAARNFITGRFESALNQLDGLPHIDNPKGELQELLQATAQEPPRYSIVSVTGPDHDRVFECVVKHKGEVLARGLGKSKKAAESNAAMQALLESRNSSSVTEGET